MSKLANVKTWGQSIWLDNLSRTLIQQGDLARLVAEDGISGVTSNPAIFRKALAESPYYQADMSRLKNELSDAEARYEALVIPDIQAACDLLMPTWQATQGNDGYVSLEVSPALANDTEGTILAARRLHARVNKPNVLIKIPATAAGITAFEQVISEGISINITLIFSLRQTDAVFAAYVRGLQRLVAQGGKGDGVKAVASLFLSRIDSHVDPRLAKLENKAASALQGHAALAVAKLAYQHYKMLFHGEGFAELANAGCRPQYLLWASTGTKNSAYSDVQYLDNLIGPETINTVPDATLNAFRDHGHVASTVDQHLEVAHSDYQTIESLGIDLNQVGETLQQEGLVLFDEAYRQMVASC
ncbi:MAG: transaldolase [Betaproteobacteria bacterium]|nr:transaldolase [Betaproteobacteria bacterium]